MEIEGKIRMWWKWSVPIYVPCSYNYILYSKIFWEGIFVSQMQKN